MEVAPQEEPLPVDSGYEENVPEKPETAFDVFDSSDDEESPCLVINGTVGVIGKDTEVRDDKTEGEYTLAFKIEVISHRLASIYAIYSLEPLRLSPARLVDLPFEDENFGSLFILNRLNVEIVFPFNMVYLR